MMTRCSNTDDQPEDVTCGDTFSFPYPAFSKTNPAGLHPQNSGKGWLHVWLYDGPTRAPSAGNTTQQDENLGCGSIGYLLHNRLKCQTCNPVLQAEASWSAANFCGTTTHHELETRDMVTPHGCSLLQLCKSQTNDNCDEGDHQYTEPL